MADSNHQEIWDEFRSLVNMTPSELENWLDSDESKAVGQKSEDGGESVGHKSGHTIIEIPKRTSAVATAGSSNASTPSAAGIAVAANTMFVIHDDTTIARPGTSPSPLSALRAGPLRPRLTAAQGTCAADVRLYSSSTVSTLRSPAASGARRAASTS